MSERSKRVVFLTAMPFWRLGGGAFTRDIALMWCLGQELRLTVVYAGATPPPADAIRALGLPAAFIALAPVPPASRAELLERFRELCLQRRFDVCVVDRVEPAYLLAALPPGTRTFLDTHDVPGDEFVELAGVQARAQGAADWRRCLEIYRRFDRVIAIQDRDRRRLAASLGSDKVILAPHPVTFERQRLRSPVKVIGLVASDWKYNIEGFAWFLSAVWPQVEREALELHLFGRIGAHFAGRCMPNVVRRGFVLDLAAVYREIDIVINPIRTGSGLKIKTVEALGNGLPLVTTSEGARGLEPIAGRAFLVADEGKSFAHTLNRLIADAPLRAALAVAAYAYASEHLSPDACFGPLLDEVME